MRILRNYILKEFLGPFFASLAVLTLVMLLGNLIRLAHLIINKGVDLLSVSKLFIFLIPSLLIYTMPLSVLMAILLSLGRLSSDNEIIAIRSSGISILRLIVSPLLIVGLILSLTLLVFCDRIIPYAHFASRQTLSSIGINNPTAIFEAGTFIKTFDQYIIFIHNIEGNRLQQVIIYEPQEGNKPCRTIVAKEGEFLPLPDEGMVKLKLINGTSDEPDLNNPGKFYKLNFKSLFLNLNLTKANSSQNQKKAKDMTLSEIKQEIQLGTDQINASQKEIFPLITELHKRIALAFSVTVFVLLGCGIALITRRREKSINFSMAFAIAIVYYLILLGANALSLGGSLNPALAMWLPNIVLGTAGLILTLKICVY